MKKLTVLLAAAMLLSLTACSLSFLNKPPAVPDSKDGIEAVPPSIGQDEPDTAPDTSDSEGAAVPDSPDAGPLPDPDGGGSAVSDPPANGNAAVIQISHSDVTLKSEGETFRLSVRDSAGNAPSACTFTSDDPEIASVDETGGQVTAVAPGIANITAHAKFSDTAEDLTCIVRCRWEAENGGGGEDAQPASGGTQSSGQPSISAFFSTLQGKYDSLNGLMVLDSQLLDTYYPGLSSVASVEEVLIQEPMINISNMAVGLVKLSDDATMDDIIAVTNALQSRITDQANGGAFYPQSCEIWEQGVTASVSNVVGMFVYPDEAQSMADLFVATYSG